MAPSRWKDGTISSKRWRQKLADMRELDGLKGQVDRSGKQAMGLFLSINGWSEHVPKVMKQNPEKSIILMDGYDLRAVLSGQADLRDFSQPRWPSSLSMGGNRSLALLRI